MPADRASDGILPALRSRSCRCAQAPLTRLGALLPAGLIALLAGTGCESYFEYPPQKPPCVQRCGPRDVPPLEQPVTYRSSVFGFEVDYPRRWSSQRQDGTTLVLKTALGGQFIVSGQRAGRSDQQLVMEMVGGLSSSRWQDVQALAPIRGAQIGFQSGAGTLYAAIYSPPGGVATRARLAVIAATRGDLSVQVMGIDPADTKSSPSGIPEDHAFDYVLSQFRWP